MTIDKLPSSSYRIREQVDGKRYTLTVPYKPTKREAARLIQEKVDRQATPTGRLTIEKACNDYIGSRTASRSPSTLYGYDTIVREMPDWLKKTYVADADQRTVQKYIDEMLTGVSDRTGKPYSIKTIRSRSSFLLSVLTEVRPELRVKVSIPAQPKKDIEVPEDDDVRLILDHAKGTKYEAAIYLAALGLRRSEICAAELEDLDGTDLYIHRAMVKGRDYQYHIKAYGKTSASTRHVTIPEYVADLIRQQGEVYNGSPDSIGRWLERAQKATGAKSFSLHKLRHYFASQAHSMGIPDAYIMAMGGWSTTAVMTTVYRHAQQKKEEEEKKKFADHLAGLSGDS